MFCLKVLEIFIMSVKNGQRLSLLTCAPFSLSAIARFENNFHNMLYYNDGNVLLSAVKCFDKVFRFLGSDDFGSFIQKQDL